MFVIQQALDSFYNERLEAFGGILDSDDPALIAETLREEFKEATSWPPAWCRDLEGPGQLLPQSRGIY